MEQPATVGSIIAMRTLLAVLTAAALLLAAGCSRITYAPASNKQPGPQKQPQYDLDELARRIHSRVNAVRTERDQEQLTWNATLAKLARRHSQDMADRDFFKHENPDGQNATERGREADFSCRIREGDQVFTGIAENIFYTYPYRSYKVTRRGDRETTQYQCQYQWKTPEELAREIVQGWMESPGHRRNLLNPRHQTEGLGLARAEDDRIYITQNFC